jgi:hypothetical protein
MLVRCRCSAVGYVDMLTWYNMCRLYLLREHATIRTATHQQTHGRCARNIATRDQEHAIVGRFYVFATTTTVATTTNGLHVHIHGTGRVRATLLQCAQRTTGLPIVTESTTHNTSMWLRVRVRVHAHAQCVSICRYMVNKDAVNKCVVNESEPNLDNAACPLSSQWKCANGRCIPALYRCDGQNDCHDGSDERADDGSTCVAPKVCNGTQYFQCETDRKCILTTSVCDGINGEWYSRFETPNHTHTPDCGDWSDEKLTNCPNGKRPKCEDKKFSCENGRCIPEKWVCDSDNDCADGR